MRNASSQPKKSLNMISLSEEMEKRFLALLEQKHDMTKSHLRTRKISFALGQLQTENTKFSSP